MIDEDGPRGTRGRSSPATIPERFHETYIDGSKANFKTANWFGNL